MRGELGADLRQAARVGGARVLDRAWVGRTDAQLVHDRLDLLDARRAHGARRRRAEHDDVYLGERLWDPRDERDDYYDGAKQSWHGDLSTWHRDPRCPRATQAAWAWEELGVVAVTTARWQHASRA